MLRVQCLSIPTIPPPHASPAGSHSQSRVPSVRCIHVMASSGNTPDGSWLAKGPWLGAFPMAAAGESHALARRAVLKSHRQFLAVIAGFISRPRK